MKNTQPNALYRVRSAGVLGCCAALVLLAGCLGPREIVGPNTFVVRPNVSVPKAEKVLEATLGVRDFAASQPYDRRMVVLEKDYRLGTHSNDTWAEAPTDVLTRCVTDALVACGHFSDVGNAFDMARPDAVLTGDVRAFHENRAAEPAAAEVELRLELREARSPKVLWAATLRESEALAGSGTNALAIAMNAAVGRLCARVAGELSTLEFVPQPPDSSPLNFLK